MRTVARLVALSAIALLAIALSILPVVMVSPIGHAVAATATEPAAAAVAHR